MGRSYVALLVVASCMLLAQLTAAQELSPASSEAQDNTTALSTSPADGAVPQLFVDQPDTELVAASALADQNRPPNGQIAYMDAPGGGRVPAIKTVIINTRLLGGAPQRMGLDLPGSRLNITRRLDLGNTAPPSVAAFSSRSGIIPVSIWVGEVIGYQGAASSAVLLTAQDGSVYGRVTHINEKTNSWRTYMVAPLLTASKGAAGPTTNSTQIPAVNLAPALNSTRHVVMQVEEPDYTQQLAEYHKQVDDVMHALDPYLPTTAPAPQPAINSSLSTASATTGRQSLQVAPAAASSVMKGGGEPPGRQLLQNNAEQDLLLVYTPAAAAEMGGETALQSRAWLAVEEANKYYADSGIPITLRVVGIRRVNYTERTTVRNSQQVDAPLSALYDAMEGAMPSVHAWRDELGADLVQVWSVGGCGVAFSHTEDEFLYFSQVASRCAGGYALAHELGHNQGCSHNSENGGASLPYAYGYRKCSSGDQNFKTIMSYDCNEVGGPSGVLTIPVFSNPDYKWNGMPAGIAATNDCARRLAETRTLVAAARLTRVILSQPSRIATALAPTQCIDAATYNNGEQLALYACHTGDNQRWELLEDGSLRLFGTNACMDVRSAGTSDGTEVQVWGCNGSPGQRWFQDTQRRLHPYVAPDKCLDLPGGDTSNYVGLIIWTCGAATSQQWLPSGSLLATPFQAQDNSIRSALNGFCLDVFRRNVFNTAPVVMWPCSGQDNQLWQLDSRGTLRSTFTASTNATKCLDAASIRSGAPVFIYDCHSGPSQRWFMDSSGALRSYRAPTKCLNIMRGNPVAATRVQLWDCMDAPQQKWSVV